MAIHSEILVHWTGKKDIEKADKTERSARYVDRLRDYLEHGLYAKRTTEASIRRVTVKNLVRICFTEIRLSQAHVHASRYGRLGIGFHRDFVMRRGGRPVIYVPSDPVPGCQVLEDSIRTLWQSSERGKELRDPLKWILAHVKRMSAGKRENFFDEMEWRLVYDEKPANQHFVKGAGEGVYRLPFSVKDVKVVVFPHGHTKRMALADKTIQKHFAQRAPVLTTLWECGQF